MTSKPSKLCVMFLCIFLTSDAYIYREIVLKDGTCTYCTWCMRWVGTRENKDQFCFKSGLECDDDDDDVW